MISFDGCRVVDLSPRIKARVHRVDGSIEEGTTDPYGKPWVMQEGRFPGDNSLFTLYSAPADDAVWHQERMTSHNGAHVQGGKGHIDHWPGMPAHTTTTVKNATFTYNKSAVSATVPVYTAAPAATRMGMRTFWQYLEGLGRRPYCCEMERLPMYSACAASALSRSRLAR